MRSASRGADEGRFKVTGVEADRYAFKTPTLRNVELTAPYMHDGSVPTLRGVIDFYNAGGGRQQPKSSLLRKLDLTEQEKSDLVAFLESLTGTVEKMEVADGGEVRASAHTHRNRFTANTNDSAAQAARIVRPAAWPRSVAPSL